MTDRPIAATMVLRRPGPGDERSTEETPALLGLGRGLDTTAPGAASSGPVPRTLDPHLRARLRLLAMLFTLAWGLSTLVHFVVWLGWEQVALRPFHELAGLPIGHRALVSLMALFTLWAAGLSLAFLKGLERGLPARLLGLSFGVLTAAGMNLFEGMVPLSEVGGGRAPLNTLWMVLFPVLVGAPPLATGVSMGLAIASVPAGWLLWSSWNGLPSPGLAAFQVSFLLMVAVAGTAPSLMWERLRRRLAQAEEQARELGSYQLLRRLGAGAMGEVWEARHRLLARPAAVKLIKPEQLAADGVDVRSVETRFRREARATAELQSPHTVALYDYGVDDQGQLFYAMELLEGCDLAELVEREGPLPAERVVYLLTQVCRSLEEAHARGLIHRDIKPSNLFLCRYAMRYDFVKVVDFGLVKQVVGTDQGFDPQLTRPDKVVGTLAYMAPEAVEAKPLDARSDLYAVGCVGWFLASGALVFPVGSHLAMMFAQIEEIPDPAPLRARGVPESLVQVLLACLAKDPAARPQSAGELEQLLTGVRTPEPWDQDRARRAARSAPG